MQAQDLHLKTLREHSNIYGTRRALGHLDTRRALRGHSEGTRALGHLRHSGTRTLMALGHLEGTRALRALRHLSTWALKALRHSGTWALRALRHLGTRAFKALEHSGIWALETLYLADTKEW